jgi:hypothetical protein
VSKKENYILETFLRLTNHTYPYGTEDSLVENMIKQGVFPDLEKDSHGNYYYKIGKSRTIFASHLDTACKDSTPVTHVFDGNMIKTDGKTILGADDKAGMVVILNMIEKKVPGLYFFFIGEEVGCVGSGLLADNWDKFQHSKYITKVVSFDRRGTSSVITHQFWGRCCSDEFGKILAGRLISTSDKLMLDIDDTGIMTDSAKFMGLVQECTNISVGYYKEHTYSESQNIEYLQILCNAVTQIDWETLPIVRTVDIDSEDFNCVDSEDFNEKSNFEEDYYSHFKYKDGVKKMYISKKQILSERIIIWNWINNVSNYFGVKSFTWNGNTLYIEDDMGKLELVGHRIDLIDMISELSSVPTKELSDKVTHNKTKKVLM